MFVKQLDGSKQQKSAANLIYLKVFFSVPYVIRIKEYYDINKCITYSNIIYCIIYLYYSNRIEFCKRNWKNVVSNNMASTATHE